MSSILSKFPYAHGQPVGNAKIRQSAADFQVIENLGYEAEGEGEHAFLLIQKNNLNTQDVVRRLSRLADVKDMNIGFAGLKDRVAETTQSFSIHLPGKPDPDWGEIEDEKLTVLKAARHKRKIRRGSLRGNHFKLVLRDVDGDQGQFDEQLQKLRQYGVPNYFGEQRFGRDGDNLNKAEKMFAQGSKRPKRHLRSILISAARSWIYNQVLAERIRQRNWDQLLDGEVLLLNGSNRQFADDPEDAELVVRMAQGDIHPSGPLPGKAGHALGPQRDAKLLEDAVMLEYAQWIEGLERMGVDQDRRPLRMVAEDLQWEFAPQSLTLRFSLQSGCYATSLLRELVTIL